MLERSVWRQYNNTNSFREKIAEFCKLDISDLIEDDKKLYATLKAKLTKKEMKLFAMDSAGVDDEILIDEFAFTKEELEKAKFKLYKKLIQDKTRLPLREGSEV